MSGTDALESGAPCARAAPTFAATSHAQSARATIIALALLAVARRSTAIGVLPLTAFATAAAYTLFAVVYRMNPDYLMLLFTDDMGKKMLVGGIVSQLFGALMIRKIVNIRV